ncbi:MAG: glycosyltransferase family 2 protein [Acidimicrobiales bacterium]|nr:glycosyltransferase family 2 protein [Acidimicrobiales bacterium]
MTVVIACRDRAHLLSGALDAVHAALRPGDDMVVADSASRDAAVADAARRAGAAVVRCDVAGASRARNAAAAVARGAVLAFTDDDCRPAPGWVASLAAAFDDPATGFVVGPVSGGGPSTRPPGPARRFRAPVDPIDIGHGANLACRRDAFVAVRGFDERLGPGTRWPAAEDHDLLWRLLAAGWEGAFAPGAAVAHHDWRGLRATTAVEFRYGVGAAAFVAKVAETDRDAAHHLMHRRRQAAGARRVLADIRRGWHRAALVDAARGAGLAVGRARSRAGLTPSRPRRHAD